MSPGLPKKLSIKDMALLAAAGAFCAAVLALDIATSSDITEAFLYSLD